MQRIAQKGEQALAEQRYGEAEEAFERLRQLSPGTAEVYAKLGLVYFQERKFDRVVPVLRRALKLKPDLPNLDVLLAMSLSELGQYADAMPGLEKGFRRTAMDIALKRMCGLQLERAYTGLNRDSKAVEVALELNRLFPNDPEVLYQTGRIYGNFAYLTLHKLSEVAPDSIWRHQAAGEAWESQGNTDLAIQEYREVLRQDPARAGIHFRLGRAFLDRSGPADALKEFQQELEIDPTNANAAYEIGEINRKAGQLEAAREYFTKALDRYPDFEEAHLGLASVLIAAGKAESALPHLKQAIALNPGNDVAYYRLSQAYKALGDLAQQQTALSKFQHLRAEASGKTKDLAPPHEVTRQELDPNAAQ